MSTVFTQNMSTKLLLEVLELQYIFPRKSTPQICHTIKILLHSWRHHLEKISNEKIKWKIVFLKFSKTYSESIPHVPPDDFFWNSHLNYSIWTGHTPLSDILQVRVHAYGYVFRVRDSLGIGQGETHACKVHAKVQKVPRASDAGFCVFLQWLYL